MPCCTRRPYEVDAGYRQGDERAVMSRPRILLTGATGVLGQRLRPLLAELGDCVGLGFREAPISGYKVDLTDRGAAQGLLDRVQPHVVLHAAALTDVDRCERDQAAAYKLNVEATRHLVDWVVARGAEAHMVYISTDQVYDSPGDSPEESVSPVNVYALTKLWAEDLIRRLEWGLVLRTNFFGFGDERHRTFVDWVVESSRAGRPITLFEDVLFNPLQVDDLAAIITRLVAERAVGTYNVGASGGGLSKGQFIRMLAGRLDLPTEGYREGSLGDVDLAARRPRDMRMNVKRLAALLGQELPSVAAGIDRLVEGAAVPSQSASAGWQREKSHA